MPTTTRILSDIHFGHKASIVKDIDQLEELCSGVDELVFNGDTLEQKYEDSPKHKYDPLPSYKEFSERVSEWAPNVRYISGNHDPSISKVHYHESHGGDVFVTHGDALFETIAPWSSNVSHLEDAISKEFPNGPEGDIQQELQSLKNASVAAHEDAIDYDPTGFGKAFVFIAQIWPPTRPFKIFNAWAQTPRRAVEFARRHGKNPKVIVIGHTHLPGCWQHDSVWVINTGSFFPWPTRYTVEITESSVCVKKIVKKNRRFCVGETKLSISL